MSNFVGPSTNTDSSIDFDTLVGVIQHPHEIDMMEAVHGQGYFARNAREQLAEMYNIHDRILNQNNIQANYDLMEWIRNAENEANYWRQLDARFRQIPLGRNLLMRRTLITYTINLLNRKKRLGKYCCEYIHCVCDDKYKCC